MPGQGAFYEDGQLVGETNQQGLRYRLYYSAERHLTIYVLVPGQRQVVDAGAP